MDSYVLELLELRHHCSPQQSQADFADMLAAISVHQDRMNLETLCKIGHGKQCALCSVIITLSSDGNRSLLIEVYCKETLVRKKTST